MYLLPIDSQKSIVNSVYSVVYPLKTNDEVATLRNISFMTQLGS